MMPLATDTLAAIPGVRRGLRRQTPVAATGIAELDGVLQGGWPIGALSQLIEAEAGLGLSLIMPLARAATQDGRHAALVAPPFIPYAPALAAAGVDLARLLWITPRDQREALWASEQLLRAGTVTVVALWSPPLAGPVERRLQLAAEAGVSIAIAAQTGHAVASSVAAVRLVLAVSSSGLQMEVLRCRGTPSGTRIEAAFGQYQVA